MGGFGRVWDSMGLHGTVWEGMGQCGRVWEGMGQYGTVWEWYAGFALTFGKKSEKSSFGTKKTHLK